MLIAKDKTYTIDDYFLAENTTDENYYSANTPELIAKVRRFFPNFDFITDENDWLIDITPIGNYPLTDGEKIENLITENIELSEQNQMLTDCILEMSEILYGGEEE